MTSKLYLPWGGWEGTRDPRAILLGWSFSQCGVPQSFASVLAPSRSREPGVPLDPLTLCKAPHSCQSPPRRPRDGGCLRVYGPLWSLPPALYFQPQPAPLPSNMPSPKCLWVLNPESACFFTCPTSAISRVKKTETQARSDCSIPSPSSGHPTTHPGKGHIRLGGRAHTQITLQLSEAKS